jgi:hypothetical protein
MKANKEFEQKIIQYEKNDKQISELKNQNDKIKDELISQFDFELDNEFIVDDGQEKNLSARLVENKKIEFDFDKIFVTLPKEKLDTIIEKSFIIEDQEKFIEIIKQNKGLKDLLKPAISVNKTINSNKLEYAFSKGIISEDDLKGCYNVKVSKYVKISRKKKNNE